MLYTQFVNRRVVLCEAEVGSFERAINNHEPDCLEAVDMLCEELESLDPDGDEIVGRLNDDYDVFNVSVPGQTKCKLLVSIKYGAESAVFVHLLFSSPLTHEQSCNLSAKCLRVMIETWEEI